MPVPKKVPLKDRARLPADRHPGAGHRQPAIVTGRVTYGLDARAPGMLLAGVLHPPFGHRLASLDGAAARAVPGVRRVVRIDRFPVRCTCVTASRSSPTRPGRRCRAGGAAGTWERVPARRCTARRSGRRCTRRCSARASRSAARATWTARSPARPGWSRRPTSCRSWPTCRWSRSTASPRAAGTGRGLGPDAGPRGVRELGGPSHRTSPTAVTVHMARSGGGFGRRLMSDYGAEAALLSRESGRAGASGAEPRGRPEPRLLSAAPCTISAPGSTPTAGVAWSHHLANTSRYAYAENGQPPVGVRALPRRHSRRVRADFRLAYTHIACGIPGGAWRSTLHSSNAFAVQSFMDELAHATGRDPLAFRLELLGAARSSTTGARRAGADTGRLAACSARGREGRLGVTAAGGRGSRHRRALHFRRLRGARGGVSRARRRSGCSGWWRRWTADWW